MRSTGRWLAAAAAAAVLGACDADDPAAELERRRVDRFPPPTGAPVEFSRLAPGDSLAGLRIDSIDVLPDPVDSFGWMGTVAYSGEVTLVGEVRPHMDYPDLAEICFFADDSVAERLPRFPNDVRRSWLCFSNQDEAAMLLGEVGDTSRARIRIDRFQYIYQHTDVYNRARLVAGELLR